MYIKKEELIDKIFYCAIILYFFFSEIALTMSVEIAAIGLISKLMRYVSYGVFGIIIVMKVVDFRNGFGGILSSSFEYMCSHILLVTILLTSLISTICSGEMLPIIVAIVVWACSFYDFKKIAKIYFYVSAILMYCTWILSIMNVITNVAIWREDKIRYSIGYGYPLEVMTHYLFIVLCYIYILDKKFGIKNYIAVNVIGTLLYVITDARTSFYLLLLVSTIALVYAKSDFEMVLKKIPLKVYYSFVAMCVGCSILGGLFYSPNNNMMTKIDVALSGRLKLMNDAFRTYGFTFFGQEIEWVGFGGQTSIDHIIDIYNFVDCAYAKGVLDFGIVFSLFIFIGYAFMYRYAIKKKEYILIIVITIVLVVSIMEPRLISIEMNPFLLLLGYFYLQPNKYKFIR